jgi:hypothetical protein
MELFSLHFYSSTEIQSMVAAMFGNWFSNSHKSRAQFETLGFVHFTMCFSACFVCVLQGPKEEELDENEWWDKLEKLKVNNEQQEIVIKRNFGRRGAEVFEDFAYQLGLHL